MFGHRRRAISIVFCQSAAIHEPAARDLHCQIGLPSRRIVRIQQDSCNGISGCLLFAAFADHLILLILLASIFVTAILGRFWKTHSQASSWWLDRLFLGLSFQQCPGQESFWTILNYPTLTEPEREMIAFLKNQKNPWFTLRSCPMLLFLKLFASQCLGLFCAELLWTSIPKEFLRNC